MTDYDVQDTHQCHDCDAQFGLFENMVWHWFREHAE